MRFPLYFCSDIYDTEYTTNLFLEAMRDNLAYHRRNNRKSRSILKQAGFLQRPGSLTSVEALAEIPPLPTALFKKETLWTMSRRHMAVRATSSGTSGTRSEIGYDWESVWFGFLLALGIGRCHGIFSPVPAHYLMLGYEPCRENRTIIVKTQRISSFFAPPAGRTYALRWKNGAYHLDIPGLLRALSLYSRSALPVRIIGFPSYLYFLLQYLKQEGKRFCLPANSMVLLGGGWKGINWSGR